MNVLPHCCCWLQVLKDVLDVVRTQHPLGMTVTGALRKQCRGAEEYATWQGLPLEGMVHFRP